MSWSLLLTLVFALGIAFLSVWARRTDLRRMAKSVAERDRSHELGGAETKLQHPTIDLSRCLGCGTCVQVCPEEGVLALVHGQAAVVNPARCVGVAECERECPVGAITVTLTNLETRRDVPVLDESLEAIGSPGLFLAGEVTAHALIKSAVEQGTAVAAEVARRVAAEPIPGDERFDLVVVGAGPAGIACLLEARRLGLRAIALEQEQWLGGTVAKYPRRKLVLTMPVELPLGGALDRPTYTKEELIELWQRIAAEHELPVEYGQVFTGLLADGQGGFEVRAEVHHEAARREAVGVAAGAAAARPGTAARGPGPVTQRWAARHVCLAIGRRGVPRLLGVPGEELPKVAYSLLDAHSFTGRRILVVGGGDSAVEAALALAEQPGNQVTLSYRKAELFRIRTKNQERVQRDLAAGRLKIVFHSEVVAIRPDAVELDVQTPQGLRRMRLPNDDVFVMIGGIAPFELLEQSGVSFDPELRPKAPATEAQGTGLMRALGAGFVLSLGALTWALWHFDYYAGAQVERATSEKHTWLRPGDGLGLWLGIFAVVLIVMNLAYLVRRSPRLRVRLGSLQAWMSVHVATGTLALLCALLHAAMNPRDTPGGHAFWGLVVLFVSGAIGRYFYAYVPRATNGRELALAEVRAKLGRASADWDREQARFRQLARERIDALLHQRQWRTSFVGRLLGLLGMQRSLRKLLRELAATGRRDGVPEPQIRETVQLAREAHWLAVMAAHYEDLRALLATWRYVHRWVAALMVLLVIVHVVHALAYGSILRGGGG